MRFVVVQGLKADKFYTPLKRYNDDYILYLEYPEKGNNKRKILWGCVVYILIDEEKKK